MHYGICANCLSSCLDVIVNAVEQTFILLKMHTEMVENYIVYAKCPIFGHFYKMPEVAVQNIM